MKKYQLKYVYGILTGIFFALSIACSVLYLLQKLENPIWIVLTLLVAVISVFMYGKYRNVPKE